MELDNTRSDKQGTPLPSKTPAVATRSLSTPCIGRQHSVIQSARQRKIWFQVASVEKTEGHEVHTCNIFNACFDDFKRVGPTKFAFTPTSDQLYTKVPDKVRTPDEFWADKLAEFASQTHSPPAEPTLTTKTQLPPDDEEEYPSADIRRPPSHFRPRRSHSSDASSP